MESKALSSLYLCGDDSDENTFGGISNFDNMDLDVAVPDLGYDTLRKRQPRAAATGEMYFPGTSADENIPSGSSEADCSRQPSTLLSTDDLDTFTSQNSGSDEPKMLNSLLTGFAESFLGELLPDEKISNAKQTETFKGAEPSRNRILPKDSFADFEADALHALGRSNSNFSSREIADDGYNNGNTVAGYRGSFLGRRRSREEMDRERINGETTSNEESEDEGIHAEGSRHAREKFDEDDEEFEEECEDEEEDSEDEEEEEEEQEEEEETVAEDIDVKTEPMDSEDKEDQSANVETDVINEFALSTETSEIPQPDTEIDQDGAKNLKTSKDRTKKPRKKKKVPTATLR